MRCAEHPANLRAAVREEDSSLFVALELSKSTWLIAAWESLIKSLSTRSRNGV
jgi:hypothetical protein